MAKIDNHRGEDPRGLRRDMRQVRTHGSATMQELREFLANMKGKRPQEVLGMIAQSSLIQGMFWSTVIVGVLLVGCTFASWGYKKSRGDFEPVAKQQAEQPDDGAAQEAAPAGNDAAQPPEGNSAAPSGTAASGAAAGSASPAAPADPAAAVADPLGIGETRLADPKVNPLENRSDDILSELNK